MSSSATAGSIDNLDRSFPIVEEAHQCVDESAAALSQQKIKPKTYALLDAGRGLACLWVVCHHSLGFIVQSNPTLSDHFLYSFALNGALGVWVFFVISGYCIANTAASSLASGRPGWVYARVRRIFPPMWYSAILCAMSALFAQWLVTRGILRSSHLASTDLLHQTPLFFLSNLTLTQELFHQPMLSGVYWTLCYEVGFYALVALALIACRRLLWSTTTLLKLLHALTALCIAGLLLFPARMRYPLDLWPHFGIGVLVFDVLRNGWRSRTYAMATLVLAGVAAFAMAHPHRGSYVDRGGSTALITSAIVGTLLLLLHPLDAHLAQRRIIRALSWVGIFSYSLYLTHVILIGYVFKLSQMFGIIANALPVYLLLTVAACVSFAWLFFKMFEQPFMGRRRQATIAAMA